RGRPVVPSPRGNRCSMFSHWSSVRSLGYRFRAVVLMPKKITLTPPSWKDYFLDGLSEAPRAGIRKLNRMTKTKTKPPKAIAGTRSLSTFVKSICDILRRSNCASALQYVPELTWILFLRILDEQEKRDREAADAVGELFTPALCGPFRWQDWAAPY